jgi:hypothetical protein
LADNVTLNSGSGGAVLATDDVSSVHYQRVKLDYGGDGVAAPVTTATPLPVGDVPADAKSSTDSDAAVAAGGQGTVDSTQISSSKTGKLVAFIAASTVPIKVTLQTVTNAVGTTKLVTVGETREVRWTTPHKDFITVAQDAGAGLDGFRLLIDNLDTSQAADVYGTFFWDEV